MNALRVRYTSFNRPGALFEEVKRVVVSVGLDILWEGKGCRAGFHRIREDAHGFGQRGQELLGPGDTVKKAAHRTKAIVDADVRRYWMLELL